MLLVTLAATLAIGAPIALHSSDSVDSDIRIYFLPGNVPDVTPKTTAASGVGSNPGSEGAQVSERLPVLAANTGGVNGFEAGSLAAQLAHLVEAARLVNSVAIAVTDLNTGITTSYRAEELQRSGCVVNFFVLVQALRDVADGTLDFADAGPVIEEIAGYSDASAAYDLYAMVGGGDVYYGLERVSRLIEETVGPGKSILDHPPGFEWRSLGINEHNYVTSDAMNRALASLYRGDLLPEPWGSYLLDLMANVTPGLNYLLADLPGDVLVSHKNGWFDFDDGHVENDTAIVRYGNDGITSAYAITFMSDSPDVWRSIELAQSVTHLVYTWFGGIFPAAVFVDAPDAPATAEDSVAAADSDAEAVVPEVVEKPSPEADAVEESDPDPEPEVAEDPAVDAGDADT